MCYREHMTFQLIRYEASDGIAQITLDRPEKLNAWTPQMAVEQADALRRANDDRSVGAIVMTGAGRAFRAGADMELTFKSRIEGCDPGEDALPRPARGSRQGERDVPLRAALRRRRGGGVRARRPAGRAREAPRGGPRAGARDRRQSRPAAPHDEGALDAERLGDRPGRGAAPRERDAARLLEEPRA